jgi:hypothetical protein
MLFCVSFKLPGATQTPPQQGRSLSQHSVQGTVLLNLAAYSVTGPSGNPLGLGFLKLPLVRGHIKGVPRYMRIIDSFKALYLRGVAGEQHKPQPETVYQK